MKFRPTHSWATWFTNFFHYWVLELNETHTGVGMGPILNSALSDRLRPQIQSLRQFTIALSSLLSRWLRNLVLHPPDYQRSTFGSKTVSTYFEMESSMWSFKLTAWNEQSQASPSTAFETSVVLNDEEVLTEHRLGYSYIIDFQMEWNEGGPKESCDWKCSSADKPTFFQGEGLSEVSKVWTAFFCNSCYERWHASTIFFIFQKGGT